MEIKKLLKKENINFKEQEYDKNITLFKVKEKLNIVCIEEKSSTFLLERDLFFYLDNQKIPYAFLLINLVNKKVFYLDFKSKTNWLSSGFERSDKESLYFGKIVLKNESNYDIIIKKIKRI